MTVLFSIFNWFLSPIGRYVGLAILAAIAYGAWDLTIRHSEDVRIQQKEHIERQHAVQKGTSARDRATRRFDNGRLRNDGFRRD